MLTLARVPSVVDQRDDVVLVVESRPPSGSSLPAASRFLQVFGKSLLLGCGRDGLLFREYLIHRVTFRPVLRCARSLLRRFAAGSCHAGSAVGRLSFLRHGNALVGLGVGTSTWLDVVRSPWMNDHARLGAQRDCARGETPRHQIRQSGWHACSQQRASRPRVRTRCLPARIQWESGIAHAWACWSSQ